MSVLVAVPDSVEGVTALAAAGDEAKLLDTDLIVVNTGLRPLDPATIPTVAPVTVIERHGSDQRDPVDVVLAAVEDHHVHRLVVGVRLRSPVGKALLGSLSQRLLLASPVPVLAVKATESADPEA